MADVDELLRMMKSVPAYQAIELLRVLRSAREPAAVLSIVKGGMDGKQRPSDYNVTQNLTPPTDSGLEFELAFRHPISYPPLMPIEANGYLVGPSEASTSSASPKYLGDNDVPDIAQAAPPYPPVHPLGRRSPSPLIGPLEAPKYCDERLCALKIGFWTRVPITDEFAARVISMYLETDHPVMGAFDPDLFVLDLVNHRERFCSRLLVSALLCWACQMYSGTEPSASAFAWAFGNEAEKLWKTDRAVDTVLNMAAAQLLGFGRACQGVDQLTIDFLREAGRIGRRMCLFGPEAAQSLIDSNDVSNEWLRARSFAAWGIFNWFNLTAQYYQQPDAEYPECPPRLPIPGDENACPREVSDDVSSTRQHTLPLPRYMGWTFPALCKFWIIMHEVTLLHFKRGRRSTSQEPVPLRFAEYKYRELLAWADTIPALLSEAPRHPHHIMVFRIWYHAAILDLFRPFTQDPEARNSRLKTFSSPDTTPFAVHAASVNQLKWLVLEYVAGYPSASYSILWHGALLYVANAMLRNTADPEWRFYFLRCIYGYEKLHGSYRIAKEIAQGLLSMARRECAMSSGEVQAIIDRISVQGRHHLSSDKLQATFMVDLDLAVTDHNEAQLHVLAQKFEDMVLFGDFVEPDKLREL